LREMGPAHTMNGYLPKIVVIGGGSGSSVLLRGLKNHPASVSSVVTVFDSGGSSGLLTDEFGYLPFGDLRQCLLALSDESEGTATIRSALDFRFSKDSSLNGHSMGNLLLAALTTLRHDVEGAVDELSAMLRIKGAVLPVALKHADLCAELEDGSVVRSESAIDLRGNNKPHISRVFIDPVVQANPRAVKAVQEADVIVLGPGDLYTSIVPNLLPEGMASAVKSATGKLVFICNLMTKPGETEGYKASDFASQVVQYAGRGMDAMVVNTGEISGAARARYAEVGAEPVFVDTRGLARYSANVIEGDFVHQGPLLRHDAARLARTVLGLASRKQFTAGLRGRIGSNIVAAPAGPMARGA